MIKHKTKLTFALFVISILYFSGSSSSADAAADIFVCHFGTTQKVANQGALNGHLNNHDGDFAGTCEDVDVDGDGYTKDGTGLGL
jgi:hypothetical protein